MRRRTRVVAFGAALLLAGCGATSPLPINEQAAHYRLALRDGQVVARLCLPRFHSEVAILDGFDQATINRGPGWFPGSRLPGEGRLIYIAGHHRTHGAPFRHVADLDLGDRVVIITPYATASYVVTSHTTISGRDLAVLRSPAHEILRLQTSTVPAGPQRILVTATLSAIRRGNPDMRSRGCGT
jgi:LPXTG-site transpeptidase (sortase) family protein